MLNGSMIFRFPEMSWRYAIPAAPLSNCGRTATGVCRGTDGRKAARCKTLSPCRQTMLNRKQKLRARRSPVVDAKVLDKPFDTVRADRGSADRHGRRSPDTAAVSGRRREAEQIVFLQGFGSPSRQPPALQSRHRHPHRAVPHHCDRRITDSAGWAPYESDGGCRLGTRTVR